MRRSAPSPWRGTNRRRLSVLSNNRFVKAGGVIGYGNVLAARTNGGYRRYFAVAAGIGRPWTGASALGNRTQDHGPPPATGGQSRLHPKRAVNARVCDRPTTPGSVTNCSGAVVYSPDFVRVATSPPALPPSSVSGAGAIGRAGSRCFGRCPWRPPSVSRQNTNAADGVCHVAPRTRPHAVAMIGAETAAHRSTACENGSANRR